MLARAYAREAGVTNRFFAWRRFGHGSGWLRKMWSTVAGRKIRSRTTAAFIRRMRMFVISALSTFFRNLRTRFAEYSKPR